MFTFKKHIPTGRYRSFEKDHTDIKIKKKVIGYIAEVAWDKYQIHLAIKKKPTEKDPSNFKWANIIRTFSNEKEAREFLQKNFEKIKELNLYSFDD